MNDFCKRLKAIGPRRGGTRLDEMKPVASDKGRKVHDEMKRVNKMIALDNQD